MRVCFTPEGKDAAEFFERGGTLETLLAVAASTPTWRATSDDAPTPASTSALYALLAAAHGEPEALLPLMNAHHIVVPLGRHVQVRRTLPDGTKDWITPEAVRQLYGHLSVRTGGEGRPPRLGTWSAAHAGREVRDRVVFVPQGEAPPGALNLYRGWGSRPHRVRGRSSGRICTT